MTTKVFMIESERGWGSKIDEVKEFPTYDEALKFCDDYNKKWNSWPMVPDWYIVARMEDEFK
jgi:hypothetical protein